MKIENNVFILSLHTRNSVLLVVGCSFTAKCDILGVVPNDIGGNGYVHSFLQSLQLL